MGSDAPLRIGSAFPDPPFEVAGHAPTGLDIDLMTAIAAELGRPVVWHRYEGADFNGIFAELGRSIDVVASGATITSHRLRLARWCRPYLRSGQSLAVANAAADLVLGVQEGNTSEPVARAWHAAGKVKAVKVYAYQDILTALDDLEHGVIGGFMKLEPVLRWLIADRPMLRITQTGITKEILGYAVALDEVSLATAIDSAQESLRRRGELDRLTRKWLK